MAITLSTGSTIAIASAYSSPVVMSAVTNSADAVTEAVATVASAAGITAGTSYVEITSGWGRLDKRVVRVKTVAGLLLTLEGVYTNNTTLYPNGGGVGTIRVITGWTNLSQIKDISSSGGEQQFADITAIDDTVEKKQPTIRGAVSMTMNVFDDPTLPWYSTVTAASDTATPTALRISLANGSKLAANAYWGLQKVPTITKNEALGTSISLSYASDPIRYSGGN